MLRTENFESKPLLDTCHVVLGLSIKIITFHCLLKTSKEKVFQFLSTSMQARKEKHNLQGAWETFTDPVLKGM